MLEDFYKILQVDPSAEQEVIEGAYRRLAQKYHPDRNSAPDATARMSKINEAYEELKDPARRAAFDRARSRETRTGSNYANAPSGTGQESTCPPNHAQTSAGAYGSYQTQTLTQLLHSLGLVVVDKRPLGGALWVIGGRELKPLMEQLQMRGFDFTYAKHGGRAVDYNSAWWTSDDG